MAASFVYAQTHRGVLGVSLTLKKAASKPVSLFRTGQERVSGLLTSVPGLSELWDVLIHCWPDQETTGVHCTSRG